MRPFQERILSASACMALVLSASCAHRTPRPRRPPLPPPSAAAPAPAAPPEQGAPQLTEVERKAAARASFAEGIQLQDANDCAQALPRFEVAERMYDAPTHLLHIAQCQAATLRLVEAQETYATLGHLTLAPQSPSAFREAQETGRTELARLKPRVPTLRINTTTPAATLKNLAVQINGTQLPVELVGLARPINPGKYHVTMTASPSRSGAGDVEVKEGETRALDVRLSP